MYGTVTEKVPVIRPPLAVRLKLTTSPSFPGLLFQEPVQEYATGLVLVAVGAVGFAVRLASSLRIWASSCGSVTYFRLSRYFAMASRILFCP